MIGWATLLSRPAHGLEFRWEINSGRLVYVNTRKLTMVAALVCLLIGVLASSAFAWSRPVGPDIFTLSVRTAK